MCKRGEVARVLRLLGDSAEDGKGFERAMIPSIFAVCCELRLRKRALSRLYWLFFYHYNFSRMVEAYLDEYPLLNKFYW